MINVDPGLEIEKNKKKAVTMHVDFTTSADGIGERTYVAGKTYRVDDGAFSEMQAHTDCVGDLNYVFPWELARADFALIEVNPYVSRFFTSDGVDTIRLEKDKPLRVPSNLAVFLIATGYVEAA